MTDEQNTAENVERSGKLSDLGDDPAHVFDQTNGVVEGLEGDADSPDEVDKRTGDGLPAAPLPGTTMPGAANPGGGHT